MARNTLYLDQHKLLAALKELEDDVVDSKLLRSTVRAAGKPIREEARRLCPQDTGRLWASIQTRVTQRRKVETMAAVGAREHYAHLVEFGTKPHLIPYGKNDPRRRGLSRGFRHPGTDPQPFIRPAFDSKKDEAVSIARDKLRAAVLRSAKG